MGLQSALSIASDSLRTINYQLGIVSNNVANANTPDYSSEVGNQQAMVSGGVGLGVQVEATTRTINIALQQNVFQQGTVISGLTTTTSLLTPVNDALGSVGQGNDIASLLGDMTTAFSTLLGDPSNATQQQAVVTSAGNLAGAINQLSSTYNQQRQAAQNDIVSAVAAANADLSQIGTLSNQIIIAQTAGQSTADLENQRDAVVSNLSGILGIKTVQQSNGDLLVMTTSGSMLSTHADSGPLQTSPATLSAGVTYAGGEIPAITLNGTDVTQQIQGGQLGADIQTRDVTLPTFQGELDEFSYQLASRFDAQGLDLFSDPNGNIPNGEGPVTQSSYVGFSSVIQVNPAVSADPSQVRDGNAIIAGSSDGASAFVPNPTGGPDGFTTLISRVLTYALGSDAQPGVPQPASATSNLGPDGTLTAPYATPGNLADNAASLISAQAAVSTATTGELSQAQALQTTLNNSLASSSAVNIDSQMSQVIELQNAYAANAKIITTILSLFSTLEQAVQ